MNKRRNLVNDRKGQVASTTTWIVATIIIVVILVVFYYASSFLAVKTGIVKIKQKLLSAGFGETENLLMTKTAMAYLRTPAGVGRDAVEKWVDSQDEDLEDYVD